MTTRPNGLPALRDLPIKFKRRPATTDFTKLVGKETERSKHSPHEYASEDGRWIIRATQHSGRGSANNGRTRWHVTLNGRAFFGVGIQGSALSLEDAIDDIHRRIAKGVRDAFMVLANIRRTAEAAARAAERRAANLVKARELLARVSRADPSRLIEQLAVHVDLDALARAVDSASQLEENA